MHTYTILGIITVLLIASVTTSCTHNKATTSQIADENTSSKVNDVNINGQWNIEDIVFNDSTYVRPSEETPGRCQYFVFTDSTYSIMTNCNSFFGSVTISGNSIKLNDRAMTEMACDNMATEDALRKILPLIATIDVENDSIIRLNSETRSEYIILQKAKIEVK